jgi:hypothetical protein
VKWCRVAASFAVVLGSLVLFVTDAGASVTGPTGGESVVVALTGVSCSASGGPCDSTGYTLTASGVPSGTTGISVGVYSGGETYYVGATGNSVVGYIQSGVTYSYVADGLGETQYHDPFMTGVETHPPSGYDYLALDYAPTLPELLTEQGSTGEWTTAVTVATVFGVEPPCQLSNVSGDINEPTSDGSSVYNFSFSWSGDSDALAIADDASTDSSTFTSYGKSFTTDSGFIQAFTGDDLSSPQIVSYTPVSGNVVNPHMWCHYGATGPNTGGTWVDWGTVSALTSAGETTPTGGPSDTGAAAGAFDLGTCLATSGMSLTNPVSWVTGAAKDTVCVLQWVFVPSSSDIAAAEQQFGVGASNDCSGGAQPISAWVGCVASAAVSMPAATVGDINSAAASGSCADSPAGGASTLGLDGHHIGFCSVLASTSPSAIGGDGEGILGWIADFLTAAVYCLLAFALFHLLRRTLSNNS